MFHCSPPPSQRLGRRPLALVSLMRFIYVYLGYSLLILLYSHNIYTEDGYISRKPLNICAL